MARKKKEASGGPGSGDWLNTYADMVTLLLTFFILLFSMSSLDGAKFNMLVKAFASNTNASDTQIVIGIEQDGSGQEGFPPQGAEAVVDDVSLEDVFETLKQYIEEQELSDSVEISQGEGYVFIQFMNDMLFEPNSSVLKASDREILSFVGNGIKSVQNNAQMIAIHGHTAAIPDNPDYGVNDWLLSSDRSNAVLLFFDDVIGIDPQKMQTINWGKNKPFASNDTEEGRSKNRRVEILISTENSLSQQLDNVYEKLVE